MILTDHLAKFAAENDDIPGRIRRIRRIYFNDNNLEFAKFMEEKPSTTSSWASGKRNIGKSVLDKILGKMPDINANWLLTGEGEICKRANPKIEEVTPIVAEHVMQVPLVNQYAYAGYIAGYGDDEYVETLPTLPFIVDHEALGHYVAFEVKGDSMNDGSEDSYLEGDRLLCREIQPHLWAEYKLHYRKWDFVIVHQEGVLVKRVIDHDVERHTITIHSLNPMYPDRVIDLAEVRQIFNVIELSRTRRR